MPSVTELAALLAKTQMFSALGETERKAVAEAMREQRYEAGRTIFARDEDSTGLFLVDHGRVRLSVLNAEGRELSFRFVGPGEIMGEIAALDGGARTATAVALTFVSAHVLSPARLAQLLDVHPDLARATVRFLCARLRETSQQLEEIALHPIERRVARFLLSALKLTGADLAAENVPLDVKMTQSEIALLLGASRPKINVALGALEKSGAITRKGEQLICHPDALVDIAGDAEV